MNIILDQNQERTIKEITFHSDSDIVVAGGPGTGKSILALKVLINELNQGKKTNILMYNVPLCNSQRFAMREKQTEKLKKQIEELKEIVSQNKVPFEQNEIKNVLSAESIKTEFENDFSNSNPEDVIKTMNSWLSFEKIQISYYEPQEKQNSIFNNIAESREKYNNPNFVHSDLTSDFFKEYEEGQILNSKPKYDTIIIDEAQDFSIELIRLLKTYAKRLICFIDPNQAISESKTEVQELLEILKVECPYFLEKNYRNSQAILDVANLFWNGEGEFLAKAMIEEGEKPYLHKITNKDKHQEISKIVEIISKNPDKKIGIFISSNYSRKKIYEELKDITSNDNIYIATYNSAENAPENEKKETPCKDMTIVMTYDTVKGLEFDIVILPKIGKITKTKFSPNNPKADINKIFVAMTRAKEELHIFSWNDNFSDKYIDVESVVYKNNHLFQKG